MKSIYYEKKILKGFCSTILIFIFFCYSVVTIAAREQLYKNQYLRHFVKQGDTLESIAQKYQVDVKQIIDLNRLAYFNQSMIGHFIDIPIRKLRQAKFQTIPHDSNEDRFSFSEKNIKSKNYIDEIFVSYQPTSDDNYFNLEKSPLTESFNFIVPMIKENEKLTQNDFLHKEDENRLDNKIQKNKIEKQKNIPYSYSNTQSHPKKSEKNDLYKQDLKKKSIEGPQNNQSKFIQRFGVKPYGYYSNGENLSDIIKNFTANYNVPVIIDGDFLKDIEVNGKFSPVTPYKFLEYISSLYGFIWFFDGNSLYVYDAQALQQKVISLSYISIERFKSILKDIGIWENRFYWKEQQDAGLIFVSGPPRYIQAISETAELLDKKEEEKQKQKLVVKLFRLKYAWATDKTFNFRGKSFVVPGVSTLLRSIVAGGGVNHSNKNDSENVVKSLQPANGMSDAAKKLQVENQKMSKAEASKVMINADQRLNAIIVHDLEHKMPMYESIIQSLDKPSEQVEVSVSIIDVNSEDISSLGVDWSNSTSQVKFDTSGSSHDSDFGSFTTVVDLSIENFNARLQMLADSGKAKVVSRPSILTLDNLEAVFDNSSTFYVKVESKDDAELFPVTSGTVVQVTPRIVKEEHGKKIHMSVSIQNGGEDNSGGASIPRVTNSSINTQAVVHEQESLLIGGFVRESVKDKVTKVPILGDLPILGNMFRHQKKIKSKQVRLFLITPKILNVTS